MNKRILDPHADAFCRVIAEIIIESNPQDSPKRAPCSKTTPQAKTAQRAARKSKR
jgi:hypothetical protein